MQTDRIPDPCDTFAKIHTKQSPGHGTLRKAWITAGDTNCDAKLWSHLHPWGSSGLYSEQGSLGLSRLVQRRALLAQRGFCQSNLCASWFLNRCSYHQGAEVTERAPVTPTSPRDSDVLPATQQLFSLQQFKSRPGRQLLDHAHLEQPCHPAYPKVRLAGLASQPCGTP